MAKRDYYQVLSVDHSADEATLKKSYRRLAMKYHPDRNVGDAAGEAEAKFKEAKEAYDVLSDGQKRALYDQYGHAGLEQQGGGSGGGAGDFGDMFDDIFGGGGGRSRVYRGADLQYKLELSLEEAVFGIDKNIDVASNQSCDTCDGSGAKPGSEVQTCSTCAGAGQVRMQQGFFSIQQACPSCQGRGQVITDPCGDCRGAGVVRKRRTLAVKVPAGVDTGDRIRLSGEGEPGENRGPAGDLFVQVDVIAHPIFERDAADLHCEVPISFSTAALGGEIEIPSLDGRLSLKIPVEVQTSKRFRLRGKGVKPVRGGPQGDLYVHLTVETPINLNKAQKQLFEQLQASLDNGGSKHNPKSAGWLDGMKGFFDDLKFWSK